MTFDFDRYIMILTGFFPYVWIILTDWSENQIDVSGCLCVQFFHIDCVPVVFYQQFLFIHIGSIHFVIKVVSSFVEYGFLFIPVSYNLQTSVLRVN